MKNDNDNSVRDTSTRKLSPIAERALREADERRQRTQPAEPPAEIGGRGGADPARFGDWENKRQGYRFLNSRAAFHYTLRIRLRPPDFLGRP